MGTAIAVRTAYSSKELRRLASRVKNAGKPVGCLPLRPCWTAPRAKRQQLICEIAKSVNLKKQSNDRRHMSVPH
jgi:hypothetical protein